MKNLPPRVTAFALCVAFTVAGHGLLGCGGGVARANPDGAVAADSMAAGAGERIDSGPNGSGPLPPGLPGLALEAGLPPPNIYGDGGCALSASTSEGDCLVNEDCLGENGPLPCTNGKCPPFCNGPRFTDVQDPPDGSVRCATLYGPVNPDAADLGPARWCVPGQTCTSYGGHWGCCMSEGASSICVSAVNDAGGS